MKNETIKTTPPPPPRFVSYPHNLGRFVALLLSLVLCLALAGCGPDKQDEGVQPGTTQKRYSLSEPIVVVDSISTFVPPHLVGNAGRGSFSLERQIDTLTRFELEESEDGEFAIDFAVALLDDEYKPRYDRYKRSLQFHYGLVSEDVSHCYDTSGNVSYNGHDESYYALSVLEKIVVDFEPRYPEKTVYYTTYVLYVTSPTHVTVMEYKYRDSGLYHFPYDDPNISLSEWEQYCAENQHHEIELVALNFSAP